MPGRHEPCFDEVTSVGDGSWSREPPGFGHRSRAGKFDILEHCRGLGLGAVRMSLPSTDLEVAGQLRKKLESYGMRVIISLAPPKEKGALEGYEAAVKAVSEIGAVTTHASFTARRYEEFDTFEAFKASFERHQRSVELAEPILRKHKVKLAIENHKGWRAAEHAAWIRTRRASCFRKWRSARGCSTSPAW